MFATGLTGPAFGWLRAVDKRAKTRSAPPGASVKRQYHRDTGSIIHGLPGADGARVVSPAAPRRYMMMPVESLDLADTFVLFLALLGPQKVLLSFAHLGQVMDVRSVRRVAWACSLAAACVGVACALTAPWIASFFHISKAALGMAAGLTFFIYSLGLVLGVHFDSATALDAETGRPDAAHPLRSGFRVMLLPFVVSPLAIAADMLESLTANDWAHRLEVAAAFILVTAVNLAFAWVLAPLLGRVHEVALDVLSRLLGVLLAAVGVQLFIQGLTALGVLHGSGSH
jgi:multiple antibiotic resistance protein